jgi:hypothetical protein
VHHEHENRPGGKDLPLPNIEWVPSGTPDAAMTEAAVKGILIKPLHAGVGPTRSGSRLARSSCGRTARSSFLVNMLYALRRSLNALDNQ